MDVPVQRPRGTLAEPTPILIVPYLVGGAGYEFATSRPGDLRLSLLDQPGTRLSAKPDLLK
jgi:hypothetical protein